MNEEAPISRRRAETQARLLDAAVEVFAERGVLAATVEEICDRAGYTRGAFYSNFASKDELVIALINADRKNIVGGVSMLTEESVKAAIAGTREQAIAKAAEMWMSARPTDRHSILVQQEIKLYAAREPATREAYLGYQIAFMENTLAALQPVIDSFGLEFSVPPELMVEMLFAQYQTSMIDGLMYLPEGENDLKNLDPQLWAKIMAPMGMLLNAWIVGVSLPNAGE